jgi:hypothetical protein
MITFKQFLSEKAIYAISLKDSHFLKEELKIELDIRNGAGSIPWVVDIFKEKYRGFTAKVKCSKFLELAINTNEDILEKRSLEIIKTKSENNILKISPFFITIDISDFFKKNKKFPIIKVIEHEGRARAYLIKKELGDIYWPIAIHIKNYRMKDINDEIRLRIKTALNERLLKEQSKNIFIKNAFIDIDLP